MKPILFNTEMVRAILDGRKTATRRAVKPQLPDGVREMYQSTSRGRTVWRSPGVDVWFEVPAPCETGDILWVRETWAKIWYVDQNGCTYYDQPMYYYAADGTPDITLVDEDGFEKDDQRIRWHPSIHMPKEAARLFLRVTGVRVELLQDIDDDSAKAEGANYQDGKNVGWEEKMRRTAIDRFAEIWDNTIKLADRLRYGWEANPWVWVIEFERISKDEALGGGGDAN